MMRCVPSLLGLPQGPDVSETTLEKISLKQNVSKYYWACGVASSYLILVISIIWEQAQRFLTWSYRTFSKAQMRPKSGLPACCSGHTATHLIAKCRQPHGVSFITPVPTCFPGGESI